MGAPVIIGIPKGLLDVDGDGLVIANNWNLDNFNNNAQPSRLNSLGWLNVVSTKLSISSDWLGSQQNPPPTTGDTLFEWRDIMADRYSFTVDNRADDHRLMSPAACRELCAPNLAANMKGQVWNWQCHLSMVTDAAEYFRNMPDGIRGNEGVDAETDPDNPVTYRRKWFEWLNGTGNFGMWREDPGNPGQPNGFLVPPWGHDGYVITGRELAIADDDASIELISVRQYNQQLATGGETWAPVTEQNLTDWGFTIRPGS